MRAGEAWWNGKWEAWEIAIDKTIPPSLDFSKFFSAATVKTGKFREGVAWKTDAIREAQPIARQLSVWKNSKMIELASEEAAQRAVAASERLDQHLASFRSRVNNDLTSIKAASQRVQTETQSMADKYLAARDLLTSPEFERAIANAERMATALEAIGRLSKTKLSVAVFSGSQQ